MATSKSPEDDKLKRLIYLCNMEGKYCCGSPEKNKPERSKYINLLSNLLKNSQDNLLKTLETAYSDKYLPHKLQVLNILATLLTLDEATEGNKHSICQVAGNLCKSDKDIFAFLKAVVLTQQKASKKPPTTVRKSVLRYYNNKSAGDLAKSYALHKGYHGWKHKDLIKLFHIKSETPGMYLLVTHISLKYNVKTSQEHIFLLM